MATEGRLPSLALEPPAHAANLLIGVFLLAVTGCDETVLDDIDVSLSGNVSTWPVDLDPSSAATGIDNTIVLTVDFDSPVTNSTREIEWVQYQVQYRTDTELSPDIAGALSVVQLEGTTEELVIQAAGPDQLDWVFERFTGGELSLPFTVRLGGVWVETQNVTVSEEFTAVFADYRDEDSPGPNTK